MTFQNSFLSGFNLKSNALYRTNALYRNKPKTLLSWMQANRSSFFNFLFSRCLLWISLSITNLAIRSFNFLLPLFIDKLTLANVGIISSTLLNLINFMSAVTFIYFVKQITYTGRKLRSLFQTKYQTIF